MRPGKLATNGMSYPVCLTGADYTWMQTYQALHQSIWDMQVYKFIRGFVSAREMCERSSRGAASSANSWFQGFFPRNPSKNTPLTQPGTCSRTCLTCQPRERWESTKSGHSNMQSAALYIHAMVKRPRAGHFLQRSCKSCLKT